jgi:hypothetical protein
MISDFTNPAIIKSSVDGTAVSRQNQPALSSIGQKPQNSPTSNPFKFPDNDEIALGVEAALQAQAQGGVVKRGSIVNILV